MTDTRDLSRYRTMLEARRDELTRLLDLSAESRSAVTLDQTSVGRVSRIDAMQTQQMALAAGRNRQQELARIEAALVRIDNGRFGECLVCGEDIAPKRLDVDPAATTCIGCASAARR